jgi:hypothetical protein
MFANKDDVAGYLRGFDEGMVALSFNGELVGDGMFIDSKYTKETPRLIFPREAGARYTVILYDLDAPYPNNPTKSPYLHYLGTGDTILLPYQPMQPPEDSPAHRYVLKVYDGVVTMIRPPRENFNVKVFEENNNLKVYRSMMYYSKDPPEKDEELPPYPRDSMEDRYCRCVRDVKARGGRSGAYNPWAVCTKSVGRTGAVPCKGRGYD